MLQLSALGRYSDRSISILPLIGSGHQSMSTLLQGKAKVDVCVLQPSINMDKAPLWCCRRQFNHAVSHCSCKRLYV